MGLWSVIVSGVETNLDTYGFYVAAALGAGHPDPQLVTQPYAVLDGAQFQRSRVPPRTLTLRGTLIGSSLADLHSKRAALTAALRRDNADPQQPVTLKYTGGPVTPITIQAYLESGLSGGERRGFSEALGLRFTCVDPLWSGAAASQAIAVYESIAVNQHWMRRRPSTGRWDKPSSSPPRVLALAANGDVLAGISNGIYRYNGATITSIGLLNAGGYADAIIEAANGDIYVAGSFSSVDGTPAANIARRSAAGAWSALGAGLGARGLALTVGQDGRLYAGGLFTTAGGGAANYVAVWSGSAWAALGGGVGNWVYALATGLDGQIYAGGVFAAGIAAWNGSAWSTPGGGLGSTAYALAVGQDGRLYAGGAFTTAGGGAANYVATWNGLAWSPLGSGVNALVRTLAMAPAGRLYAAGEFSVAGGIPVPGSVAVWNGSAWFPLDIDLPSTQIYAVLEDRRLEIHLGWTAATYDPAIAAGGTIVANAGSAAVAPAIAVTAPSGGRLYELINHTTGAAIYLNLDMYAGEVVTIDPGAKTVSSSYRGNLLRALVPGSALGRWALLPGNNVIACYHAAADATGLVSWTNRYWGVDG